MALAIEMHHTRVRPGQTEPLITDPGMAETRVAVIVGATLTLVTTAAPPENPHEVFSMGRPRESAGSTSLDQ
jgi:hypothetical protein